MTRNRYFIFYILIMSLFHLMSCSNSENQQHVEKEKMKLMQTIEDYENAWASGDFLKVESYFSENAKRFHTEPEVWNRNDIKKYFEARAKQEDTTVKTPFVKNAWKKDRDYIDIVIDGNIAYDAFKTDRFKALHIWRKETNGNWKIVYDVGMLNYPSDN